MQIPREINSLRTRQEGGNTIMEFALVMSFLVPLFAGTFTIGAAVARAIQVSNVARDAAVLLVRTTTDPESGLDLSKTQNQRIIVRAATGLGMNADALMNPSSTGNAAMFLSKVIMVGDQECSVGVVPTPGGAPPWNAGNCPNYGSYVFAYRVDIGNDTKWSSVLGKPGGPVQADGTITAADIAKNASDRVTNFPTIMNLTLSKSTFALISEMYADVSYLNFFNILKTPVLYARSTS
jgi:TadE-like protein